MAGFLGGARIRAGEGPRNDLVRRRQHRAFAWLSGLSALLFLLSAFTARARSSDLKAFADRNFSLGSLSPFVLGKIGSTADFIYPLYLAQNPRLRRADIGETIFVSGLACF